MIIYITTNTINGRKYIGKDERNKSNYLGSGKALKNAIKKYGKEYFTKEIIAYGKNRKELEDLEKYYIDFYNADKDPLYYNITKGGNGGVTKDQAYKKVKVYQFDVFKKYIREWESAIDAATELGLGRTGIVSACSFGKTYHKSYWSRDKNNCKFKETGHYQRPIYQYDMKWNFIKKWDYLTQVSTLLKLDKGNLNRSATNKKWAVGKYRWSYELTFF